MKLSRCRVSARPLVARINAEAGRALQNVEVRERFAQQDLEVAGGARQDMSRRIRADCERYLRIVTATSIKRD